MNIYRIARTKRSIQVVTRWTREIEATSQDAALKIARKILNPKAGQSVWCKFIRTT